jgi:hypothetical protein
MDKNTAVEWSNQNYTSPDGRSFNVFATSREGGEYATVSGINSLTRNYMDNGNTLNSDDHNHPNDNPRGTKISLGNGDKGFKKDMQNYVNPKEQKLGENAKFRMLYRGKFTKY